jgi:imidazole glycerol-phosphate synthase subunit HisH
MMIGLLDYGLSNLRNVQKAFEHLGVEVQLVAEGAAVAGVDKLVLPGVGAFGAGMAGLAARGLVEPLCRAVAEGMPLLGICLGMQLLFEASEESPGVAGLGLLPGVVRRFDNSELVVPHVGWNQLSFAAADPLLDGVSPEAYAYFVHSYYCQPADPADVLATTDYDRAFAAIVRRRNLIGIQFHPEKSQATGLRILRNFCEENREWREWTDEANEEINCE